MLQTISDDCIRVLPDFQEPLREGLETNLTKKLKINLLSWQTKGLKKGADLPFFYFFKDHYFMTQETVNQGFGKVNKKLAPTPL